MDYKKFIDHMSEEQADNRLVQAYIDRLMMRLFESPALIASFIRASVFMRGEDTIIQFEFSRVPQEIHPELIKIAGAKDSQVINYIKNAVAHTALQVTLRPEDTAPKKMPQATQIV